VDPAKTARNIELLVLTNAFLYCDNGQDMILIIFFVIVTYDNHAYIFFLVNLPQLLAGTRLWLPATISFHRFVSRVNLFPTCKAMSKNTKQQKSIANELEGNTM